MLQELIFYAFAALITVCSVMVISARNAVTSAIFLVGDLFLLAGLYATMEAHFVAAIQVLVYAGAIVVLFLFVIMLLNLGPETRRHAMIPAPELGVLLLTLVGFGIVAVMLGTSSPTGAGGELTAEAIAKGGGNTYVAGMVLFTRYLWPFELSSILILLAVVASVVIAKKDKKDKDAASANARRLVHGER